MDTIKEGDYVKIKLDKVLDKFKKYNKEYKVVKILELNDGEVLYKLKGVPGVGTREMIEKVPRWI